MNPHIMVHGYFHINFLKNKEKVENSKYIFISHFHPDHLNLASLRHCKIHYLIVSQHFGARVENDLRRIGFNVISLPSRKCKYF